MSRDIRACSVYFDDGHVCGVTDEDEVHDLYEDDDNDLDYVYYDDDHSNDDDQDDDNNNNGDDDDNGDGDNDNVFGLTAVTYMVPCVITYDDENDDDDDDYDDDEYDGDDGDDNFDDDNVFRVPMVGFYINGEYIP
ncbi:hypothetical protein ElyMa_001137100 [Elysia marginata]|uniref:Prostatic spermine-binding protein-like n=1 Tax=Elysia marginata TaxID=1093978 RepID=A0AAV4I0J3_9GAST|nr:hypothetical protein ElyMa_001137100 [Elysia marginata]